MAAIQIAINEAEAIEIKTIHLQFCDKEVMRLDSDICNFTDDNT